MQKDAMQIVKHREEVMQNYFNYVLKWIFFFVTGGVWESYRCDLSISLWYVMERTLKGPVCSYLTYLLWFAEDNLCL